MEPLIKLKKYMEQGLSSCITPVAQQATHIQATQHRVR